MTKEQLQSLISIQLAHHFATVPEASFELPTNGNDDPTYLALENVMRRHNAALIATMIDVFESLKLLDASDDIIDRL